LSDYLIRDESTGDYAATRRINTAAFGRPAEAQLVDDLRANGAATLSLIAFCDRSPVGHILFSPVSIISATLPHPALALAPMAVLPEFQNQGIGSALVREGLKKCRELGHSVVFVLGHPNYYPRFDFVPASRFGIDSEYNVPDEVFMGIELIPGSLDEITGTVKYRPEFAGV
jgi:putative acetyltransferase